MNIPRILIAAPSSGSGKTVISCGLMAAFCRQQKNVVSCKCGPDYIDPMFHREVLGIDSQNLDLFFCEKEQLTGIFAEHAKNADLAVVEGVMGYYDGIRSVKLEILGSRITAISRSPFFSLCVNRSLKLSSSSISRWK